MLTRRLPGTDLDISLMGMGCWAIGGKWWGDDVDDSTSIAAIHRALDLGVNWFDTAPLYGHGHADTVLRAALDGHINDVIIATKVGAFWNAETDHAWSDLRPENIVADTEASLERLGAETIDLLQIHWPCERGTALDDTLGTLADLRTQGKIRWFGLCNYDASEVSQARDQPGMASLQTPYSLLRRDLEGPLMAACTDPSRPIGVLAYEPLCRGLLTGKFDRMPHFPDSDLRSRDERFQGQRFQHARRLVADLTRAADRLGVPTAALAVGWTCAQPGITAAIVGAKRPEQVEENARFVDLIGRDRVWRVVDGIAALHGGWPREEES